MTRWMLNAAILMATFGAPAFAQSAGIPAAVYTDPAPDKAFPARMEVLHIPSGTVAINGVVYVASGKGPHPTLVLLHGLPGNEKNLDLAQAVRRAGWNVVTFNYRGSWGSPGQFRFAQNLQDADAVLAYLRDPANAAKLGIDTRKIVIGGHSMGGWVTAMTGEHDKKLAGVILICPANMGGAERQSHADLVKLMSENSETLNVSTEDAATEIGANAAKFDWMPAAKGLADKPLLALTSDDGLAPGAEQLAQTVKAAGDLHVTVVHVATDHGWSDARVRLESEVIRWLQALP